MAKGPICIITPTGMVCCSSRPMKRHFPNEGKEDATAETVKVCAAVEAALGSMRVAGRDTILTVVQLMVQAKVTDAMPFTITATMGEGARKSKK